MFEKIIKTFSNLFLSKSAGEKQEKINLAKEHFRKGQLCRDEKDFENAVLHFKEAIHLNPEDWFSYEEIAYWLTDKLNKPEEGLKFAKKAMEFVPRETSNFYLAVLDTIGWCYFNLGKIEKAKNFFEEAFKLQDFSDPFLVLRIYHLLAAYEKTGDFQLAKELYKKIEKIAPVGWIAAEAKEKAQEIIKRIKDAELKKFLMVWNPLCKIEEKKAPFNKILKAIELLKNDRDKSKSAMKKIALDFPLDPTVIHTLAVMYYYETEADNSNEDTWKDFIGYWVMLMHHDGFWKGLKKEREGFYFNNIIDLGEIKSLRRFIWEIIEEKIPDSYKGCLSLEKKTADIMERLNKWANENGMDSLKLICGPTMLRQLNLEDKLKAIAAAGADKFPFNNDFANLMLYLSPFGIATIFIEENDIQKSFAVLDRIKEKEIPEIFRKKYVDAVLEIAKKDLNSETRVNILREAIKRIDDRALKLVLIDEYRNTTNGFIKDSDWDEAVKYLEFTLKLEIALEKEQHGNNTENNLFICYLNSADQRLKLNKPEDAVLMVEKAEQLKLTEERKKQLANIYFNCAIKFFDEDKPKNAEAMANKAKGYTIIDDELNKQLNNFLKEIEQLKKFGKEVLELLYKARQIFNKDLNNTIFKYRKALEKAEERGLSAKETKEIKNELALAINKRAVETANEVIKGLNNGYKNYDACMMLENSLRELKEAKYLSPDNEVIKENFQGVSATINNLRYYK